MLSFTLGTHVDVIAGEGCGDSGIIIGRWLDRDTATTRYVVAVTTAPPVDLNNSGCQFLIVDHPEWCIRLNRAPLPVHGRPTWEGTPA